MLSCRFSPGWWAGLPLFLSLLLGLGWPWLRQRVHATQAASKGNASAPGLRPALHHRQRGLCSAGESTHSSPRILGPCCMCFSALSRCCPSSALPTDSGLAQGHHQPVLRGAQPHCSCRPWPSSPLPHCCYSRGCTFVPLLVTKITRERRAKPQATALSLRFRPRQT